MIPLVRQTFFATLGKQAKRMVQPHQPHLEELKKHNKKSKHESIHHLSHRNQRRIKKLREKKMLDSDVVKLLKQEVREHHLTRKHLLSALKSVQKDFKEHADENVDRQIILSEVYENIASALFVAKHLDQNNPDVQQARVKLLKLQKLVKEKMK